MWFLIPLIPLILVIFDFLTFLILGKRKLIMVVLLRLVEVVSLLLLPAIFLYFSGTKNDCCDDFTAVFSPKHALTIYLLIALVLVSYFYLSYRKFIAPPIIEVISNCFVVVGLILNIFIFIQGKELILGFTGNVPIIILFISVIVKSQRQFIEQSKLSEFLPKNKIEAKMLEILQLQPIIKFPIVFLLCLPITGLIISFLLLFGQKPDSIIRAFTDTYKHGFSQLDYECANVQCGGHYLCSVAANGHHAIVKPQRTGKRNGANIICNRQLLISNAFEDLIQEKLPFIHHVIRKQYNKVGNIIHKYYDIFNNKFLSDIVYILMKPLEWIFLLALYTFDQKPENRISKQYLSKSDRDEIERHNI
jgi:hypothetical protein